MTPTDETTTKGSPKGGNLSYAIYDGVCAYCDEDIIIPDSIHWNGRNYHQKCCMKLAEKIHGDRDSFGTTTTRV